MGRKCGVYKDQIHTIIKHCYEAGAEKGDTECHYESGDSQLLALIKKQSRNQEHLEAVDVAKCNSVQATELSKIGHVC